LNGSVIEFKSMHVVFSRENVSRIAFGAVFVYFAYLLHLGQVKNLGGSHIA